MDIPGLEEMLQQNFRGELYDSREPGTVISDKWELRRALGEGGFARVYEAWHIELDHPVAIKILDARHGGPEVRQRFRDEARMLAGLSSEHLVRASDYGELPDGSPYFVMDLVEGRTLRELIRESLPMVRALELAEEILEGLSLVHSRGVIHGDIKPENVIVGKVDGKARLLDFGLAQTSVADAEEIGGTPQYMAPEMLFDGAQASARTDVYAVGAVLYEMLTGRLPRGHGGMKPEMVLHAWKRKPKADPVRMHCQAPEGLGDAMAALEQLVNEALATEPTQRFRSAEEMLEELRGLRPRLAFGAAISMQERRSRGARSVSELKSTNRLPRLPVRPWWRTPVMVSGLVAAVGLSGWGIWAVTRMGEGAEMVEAEAPTTVNEVVEPERLEPEQPRSLGLTLESAANGIVVVGSVGSKATDEVCKALGGGTARGDGATPVACVEMPASGAEDVVALADGAGAKVVVMVGGDRGNELAVHSTSHDRGNPILANLDGLMLPADTAALSDALVVLKAVVGAVDVSDVAIPKLDAERAGEHWTVLAEWFRAQQGHWSDEDRRRREALRRALARDVIDGKPSFYHDLAVLLWASSGNCVSTEPSLRELTAEGPHERAIRVAALLELAACATTGVDAEARVGEAKAMLEEAFEASDAHPCVRLAALGSISRLDLLGEDGKYWAELEARLPSLDECEAATWSRALIDRADVLADAGRWCDAAKTYARAYGALRSRVDSLLDWAECDWRCTPDRRAPREALMDELQVALESEVIQRPEQRVSVAYMRWWLTREPADARRVVERYAEVEEGQAGLMEWVASDLEQEICKGVERKECSRTLLVGPKGEGDGERLLRSLGLEGW